MLDTNVLGMNGCRVLEQRKADAETGVTPVIPVNTGVIPPPIRVHTDLVARERQRLLDILGSSQDAAIFVEGRLKIEDAVFDSAAMLGQLAASCGRLTAEAGPAMRHGNQLPPTLPSNDAHIRQILCSVTDIAVRVADRREIRVAARVLEENRETRCLSIEVRNIGIGIPKCQGENIFDAFKHTERSTSLNHARTWRGQDVSGELAQTTAGDIEASSLQGNGSRVSHRIVRRARRHRPRGCRQRSPSCSNAGRLAQTREWRATVSAGLLPAVSS